MTTAVPALRPYQQDVARAIAASVRAGAGLTFTVEFSRQAGKNETSAQLEAALLIELRRAQNIKTAPTFEPQLRISIRRLLDTLRAGRVPHARADNIVTVASSRQLFLSGEPNAKVVGHTATHLLEVDEAQDFAIEKYDKEFRPMAAANAATTVLYGTAWSELDLLHRERQAALAAERRDGLRRSFIIDWTAVARDNPAYARYVTAERARLGATNPLFSTQYELRPIPSKGRLFDERTRAQLIGEHPRATTRPTAAHIVAGLDVGGGDDPDGRPHDRTVLTLAAVNPPSAADPIPEPHVAVLQLVAWHAEPHDQLLSALIDIIRTWRVATLAVDASGLGVTVARLLAANLHATTVIPYTFSRPSKSALGFGLLSSAAAGRTKIFAHDATPDRRTLIDELRLARADYLPGQQMNFYLDPSEGHDDFLVSLALCVHAASTSRQLIARGSTRP